MNTQKKRCTPLLFILLWTICTPFVVAENLYILPMDEGTRIKKPDARVERTFNLNIHSNAKTPRTLFPTLYYSSTGATTPRSVLGPVLKINRGDTVYANIHNSLPLQTSIHWHGIRDIASVSDGVFYPIDALESIQINFDLNQPGGTAWFHPHLHGTSTDQVYRGLIGIALIEDTNNKADMQLPRSYGLDDFVLVLTDKEVTNNQQIDYKISTSDYMMRGYRGNYVLTNWQFSPSLEVSKGLYRFRVLNASTAKEIRIATDKNIPMYVIASGGGIVEKPMKTKSVFLVAGNRVEFVVDTRNVSDNSFSFVSVEKRTGFTKIFNSHTNTQSVLNVNINNSFSPVQKLPSHLLKNTDGIDIPKTFEQEREFVFAGATMMDMMSASRGNTPAFTINKKGFSKTRIDTSSKAGTWEKWTIKSNTGHHAFDHSFHVHASSFIVMSVNGKTPSLDYSGWQDTIYIRPGDVIDIALPITNSKGKYVYHCHILEHEDVGMMATLEVK